MSDDDMNREWKPNGRPQSTLARSFSAALNDLFKIDNSLADLDAAVSEKKKAVSSQTSELEALEARLRATEERLKAAASNKPLSGRSSPKPRTPLGDTFAQSSTKQTNATSPLASEFNKPGSRSGSRPVTANRPKTGEGKSTSGWRQGDIPPMPGRLPPTPGASEDGDVPPPPTQHD